jgi:hypothetical protein
LRRCCSERERLEGPVGGIARLILSLTPARCALRGQPSAVRNSFPTNSSNGRLLRRRPFLARFSLRHIRKTPGSANAWKILSEGLLGSS